MSAPASPWAPPDGLPNLTGTTVVVTRPPRRSHAGRWLVGGLIAAAWLAAGAAVLLADDGPDRFSLDAAMDAQAAAAGLSSHIAVRALGDITDAAATTNTRNDRTSLTLSFAGADDELKAIEDPRASTVYLGSEFLGDDLPGVDRPWIRIDRQTLQDAGLDTTLVDELTSVGVIDVVATVAAATSVHVVGDTTLDGEAVRVYEVIVDIDDVPDVNNLLQGQRSTIDGDLPERVVYDISVTEQNEVRHVHYAVDMNVAKVTVEIRQHLLLEEPSVELPGDDEVIDVRELL